MTHLPYILAAYAVFAIIAVALVVAAQFRLRRATTRLRTVDPRAQADRPT